MTMTEIEALATLRYSTKPEDVQHNSERIRVIRAALTAETQGVELEWSESGYLLVNGRPVGNVWAIGDGLFGWSMFMGENKPEASEAEARAALETAAREWLRIPTQPNVTELVEALEEARNHISYEDYVGTCGACANGGECECKAEHDSLLANLDATLSRAKGG